VSRRTAKWRPDRRAVAAQRASAVEENAELRRRLAEAEAAREAAEREVAAARAARDAAEAERRRTEGRRTRLEGALRAAERERRWLGDALRLRLGRARDTLAGLDDGLTEGLPWFAGQTRLRLFAVEDRVAAARAELRAALEDLEVPGRGPAALPAEAALPVPAGPGERGAAVSTADVVICVRDALEDVRRCLASLARQTDERHRLILVDDGSGEETRAALERFAGAHPRAALIRNERPVGYTRAANQGLRRATADLVVLLNSDTVVTPGWLDRLIECAESDQAIGIVGPLSNAASWQSVPDLYEGGDWALNPPPPGWGPNEVAAVVAAVSARAFPRVAFVNGFCFAVKRRVIEAIGLLDEEAFPEGYGEENDYCLRAAAAGFGLAIADHAYVYHAKSKSFSHERRRELSRRGAAALRAKHGPGVIEAGVARLREEPALAAVRAAVGRALRETSPLAVRGLPRVLFLLPVRGGGGGATSIVQEARGLRRLGVAAQVAVAVKHFPHYRATYPEFVEEEGLFFFYGSKGELFLHAGGFDVVVATIYTSLPLLAEIAAWYPDVVPAYYVQDYEPWFFPEGHPQRGVAAASYGLVPGALLFAKTHWLCETVGTRHGVAVHKVSPSLDHAVYFPPAEPRAGGPARVVAMIRPATPRRAPGRTMRVLARLAAELGEGVEIHVFGCGDEELAEAGLERGFRFTNHGVLVREEVAGLLRGADVFLDLSDYQAFGRTGLEAMACGCVPVLPAAGGAGEYAVDGENALVVETADEGACYAAARRLVEDRGLRERLRAAGLATAAGYSVDGAARSELKLFADATAGCFHRPVMMTQ